MTWHGHQANYVRGLDYGRDPTRKLAGKSQKRLVLGLGLSAKASIQEARTLKVKVLESSVLA